MPQYLLALVLGYVVGSIPSGALMARLRGGVDLTRVGSQRTGATNVLRTLGPGAAAVVFLVDFFKGSAAVLLGRLIANGDPWAMALAGIAAVFGHAYSPFIGFKGGRGVTTGLGGVLVLSLLAALAGLLSGIVLIAATRYVSLGSITGTLLAVAVLLCGSFFSGQPVAYAAYGAVVGGFIVVAHRDNIERLLRGTERRLGQHVEADL